MNLKIDHIVISVKNLKASTKFYSSFLGKATTSTEDVSWKLGDTKLFITSTYKKSPDKFDKSNLGLNHLAFHVSSNTELNSFLYMLNKAKIKNSGIQIDKYSKKDFIWFDDLDGIRLEFYLR